MSAHTGSRAHQRPPTTQQDLHLHPDRPARAPRSVDRMFGRGVPDQHVAAWMAQPVYRTWPATPLAQAEAPRCEAQQLAKPLKKRSSS